MAVRSSCKVMRPIIVCLYFDQMGAGICHRGLVSSSVDPIRLCRLDFKPGTITLKAVRTPTFSLLVVSSSTKDLSHLNGEHFVVGKPPRILQKHHVFTNNWSHSRRQSRCVEYIIYADFLTICACVQGSARVYCQATFHAPTRLSSLEFAIRLNPWPKPFQASQKANPALW